ncbi:hypothetical protein [Paenibacillus sp. SN-8-1]|uniref:hypothetical protein n=1 Tax=Paenibacillus sp. SN-8-1 TaxID=3435409 RepID=UPI003D9A24DC
MDSSSKGLAAAIAFLGICIVLGCWIISSTHKEITLTEVAEPAAKPVTEPVQNKVMMDAQEASMFLGITEDELNTILKNDVVNSAGFSGENPIPYIRIQGRYYFPVTALQQWLETKGLFKTYDNVNR